MARYIHIPGLHPAVKFPPDWMRAGWGAEKFGFMLTLTESCRYEITGPEIDGYNKAGGVAFGIYAQDQSVMLGWQPNGIYHNFCFYWHDGTGGFDFSRQPAMSAMPGEKVAWWGQVDYDAEVVTCYFQAQGGARFSKSVPIDNLGRFWRDIHPYFGDTGKPPHRMTFYKDRFWRWEDGLPYEVKQWGAPAKTIAL